MLLRSVPGFANRRPGAERQDDAILVDPHAVYIEHLHRRAGRADLESEARIGVQGEMPIDLPKDAPELLDGQKLVSAGRSEIFDLQDRLAPGIGVAPQSKVTKEPP